MCDTMRLEFMISEGSEGTEKASFVISQTMIEGELRGVLGKWMKVRTFIVFRWITLSEFIEERFDVNDSFN